jgi:hypothetical protein
MMRSVLVCFALVFVLVFSVSAGIAQAGPVQSNLYGLDGLFYTTSGKTVDAGSLALGGAFLFLSDDDNDLQTLPLTMTYGFSDDVEFGAALELFRNVDGPGGSESGIGDLYLSAKMEVQERTNEYPATSAGIRVRVPTADEDVELSGETDFAFFVAAELPLGSTLGMFNVEYLLVGESDAENQVNYAFGLKIPYTETVNFAVELLDQPIVGDILVGGALFDVSDHLNFGVGVGVGLNDPAVDVTVDGKMTLTF